MNKRDVAFGLLAAGFAGTWLMVAHANFAQIG